LQGEALMKMLNPESAPERNVGNLGSSAGCHRHAAEGRRPTTADDICKAMLDGKTP
jgi:hypothetical protein